MAAICRALVVAVLLAGPGVARCGEASLWRKVALPGELAGQTLRSICFLDPKTGWLVGDRGLCLATADGGATWARQETGSDATLRCVRFVDAKTGFLCGEGDRQAPQASGHLVMGRPLKCGSLLKTADGGRNWTKAWIPTNFEVWSLEASAAPVLQVGIGCDGHLDGDFTRSQDGGANWQSRRVFRALSDIRALDKQRWVAVGSAVSVGFTGKITDPAYLASDCRVLFSRDGGANWTPARDSDGEGCLRGLLARGGQPLWAVGDLGSLLTSEDLGESWRTLKAPDRVNLRALSGSADGGILLAVGERGIFLLSGDKGKTWRSGWVGQSVVLHTVGSTGTDFFVAGENGTLLAASVQALASAGTLPQAPPVPRAPVKPATAAQRARVRVGDFLTYSSKLESPVANCDFEEKQTVVAVEGDEYVLEIRILKGNAPPGVPKRREERRPMADLREYGDWEIGAVREARGRTPAQKRLPDESLAVNGRSLPCAVIQLGSDTPDGASGITGKQWVCVSELPLGGLVKAHSSQPMALPNGQKASMNRSLELLEWGRGEK